jgi:large subunit ribosomal protein L22
MDINVKSLFIKVSPRKLQPVMHGLRGQNAQTARISLLFTNKKGARMAADLLKSALATAKENDLELDKVYIKSIFCTSGPRLKRRHIGSRGRSDAIIKRMSHLNLVVSDIAEEVKETEVKKTKETARAEKTVETKKSEKKETKKVTKPEVNIK